MIAIVFAIFGFLIGVSIGSAAAVVALSGRVHAAYWAIAKRRPFLQQLARVSIVGSIVACGVVFAYLGHLLAE